MKTRHWVGLSAAAALFVAVIFAFPGQAQSQDEKKAPRVAPIKFLMMGISKPSMAGAKSIAKEAPASDEDWEKVECGAALINELSFLLMQNDRCPDEIWAGACQSLRASSAAYVAAAKAQDLDAAKAACADMAASCKTCHTEHRN